MHYSFALACSILIGLWVRADGPTTQPAPAATTRPADVIIVETTPCELSRRKLYSDGDDMSSLFATDKLVRKGTITVDAESFDLYLPEATRPYTIENNGRDDSHSANKSTRIAIDANHNGKISDDESWFANMPVRIADRMFDVVAIAEDGSRIELRPSNAPLAGMIVGRKAPAFTYKTADGVERTLESYKGKAFLLDIWSVT
jgi:hypothetical protein